MGDSTSQAPATQAELDETTYSMYLDCGRSAAATARQMGISPGTVRARVSRRSLALAGVPQPTRGELRRRRELDARVAAILNNPR